MNSEEIQSALNLAKDLAKNAGLALLEANLDLRKHHFDPENIKEVKSLADEVLDQTIIMGLKPTKIPILTEIIAATIKNLYFSGTNHTFHLLNTVFQCI